jgi:hypothetical protein
MVKIEWTGYRVCTTLAVRYIPANVMELSFLDAKLAFLAIF